MEPIISHELQNMTIKNLEFSICEVKKDIEKAQENLRIATSNLKLYEETLKERKNIETKNIVIIQKTKPFYRKSSTEIEIYLDAIDSSGKLINEVRFQRLMYNERTILLQELDSLYAKYGFKKIVTNMKLTNKIIKNYNVEYAENLERERYYDTMKGLKY